jgi:two-component system response regulator YesN
VEHERFSLAIVDDEPSIRQGLARYVDWPRLGFAVRAAFADGREFLSRHRTRPFDAVLTDIRRADVSGLEVAREVAREWPRTCVVIMSGYREFEYAREALQHRVREYLLKPIEVDLLEAAFRRVHDELAEARRLARADGVPSADNGGWPLFEEIRDSIREDQATDGNDADALSRRAMEYIDFHHAREISLEDVAGAFRLNPAYFSRLFKAKTGKCFIEYLTEVRLTHAAALLAREGIKVHEVAPKVGYRNCKYFTQVFKQAFGVTPQEYRHLHA